MSKVNTFYKEYDGELIADISQDVEESLNEAFNSKMSELPKDNNHQITGKFRVSITHCSEDDCDCVGLQHRATCPYWVPCY